MVKESENLMRKCSSVGHQWWSRARNSARVMDRRVLFLNGSPYVPQVFPECIGGVI